MSAEPARSRPALVLALGVLLLGGLALLLVERPRSGARARGGERAPDEGPGEAALAAPPVVGVGARESASTSSVAADFVPEPAPPPFVIQGTVVAHDPAGVARGFESGELELRVEVLGGGGGTYPLEVREGRWALELTGSRDGRLDGTLEILSCTLGGRAAEPLAEFADELPFPASGSLALEVRWLPELLLHVRARDTGRELEAVFLYESQARYASGRFHPGAIGEEEGSEVGPSPVHIAAAERAWRFARVFYARSPGYAWGRVELLPLAGGEVELVLERASELTLTIVAAARDPATRVRLFQAGEHPDSDRPDDYLDERLDEASSFRVQDLPPGAYVAEARLGRESSVLLGATRVEIVAGRRAEAVLELAPPPSAARVPLEGTLVLPADWDLARFTLSFEREGTGKARRLGDSELTPELGAPDRFRWRFPDVPPGRYRVSLFELGFVALVDTGPTGTREALVVVPPPCEVRVRCVDAHDGSVVRAAKVRWSWKPLSYGTEGSFDEAQDAWLLRAPRGWTQLQAHDRDHEFATQRVELRPGTNEFTLRMNRYLRLVLTLRDGAELVAWRPSRLARLETLDGQEAGYGELELCVTAPGDYVLVVPNQPGYEPVPPRTLRIERDGAIDVALVRKP